MAKRFSGKDERPILCPRDSRGKKKINTVPNSVIEYGPRIQGSKRLPAKYDSSKCSSDHRVPASTINSLGSRLLDPVVRVFSVHSSRMLRLCRRNRGLVGIGSGAGWVSGMAGRRRGDLGSAWSFDDYVEVQTWERERNRRRNYSRAGPQISRSFVGPIRRIEGRRFS